MLDILAWLIWLSTLMLLFVRYLHQAVWVVAGTSILLSAMSFVLFIETREGGLLIAALLTLLVKAFFVPGYLLRTLQKVGRPLETVRYLGRMGSLLVGLLLSVIGGRLFSTWASRLALGPLNGPSTPSLEHTTAMGRALGGTDVLMTVALIVLLLGAFMMIDHRKVLMQALGLVTMENGVVLLATSLGYQMPFFVELGIFFDLLVTIVVVGMLSYQMIEALGSMATDRMQRLKG
ncbi:MAG: hypothetical protein IMX04_05895 [Candidatus Carbobacillus altaicus]|uniref:Hydrogenase, membrane subunit 2-like protein n=1 Tax=Candidatus Carbonibacillus altaicus TaxID=2163959 RepID=A0A2R6Y2G4_9BACL|nr:hypothetical protein [Candidatus Carbobacillus altaicus]PTQ56835.1 MAG: Hydrogenase, membrane subunit 2-like protein [Candidatus Carbobacillus altaicus]